MKKIALAVIVTVVTVLASAGTASAGPTCSDFAPLAVDNHGEHVLRDYVATGTIAGGAPSHRGSGMFAPGASFCLPQAQSNPI